MKNPLETDMAMQTKPHRSFKYFSPSQKHRENLERIWTILKGNGASGLLLFLFRALILPPIAALQSLLAPLYRPCLELLRRLTAAREMAHWQALRGNILDTGKQRYRSIIDDLELPAPERQRLDLLIQADNAAWIKVADIDQDGFFVSLFGPLALGPCIDQQEFRPRHKFHLSLVVRQNVLGVKKDFRGNRIKFLNELKSLHTLSGAGCNIPAILDVDFERLEIVVSFIKGKVLRQKLADLGAAILDRQVAADPQLGALSAKEIWSERIQRARKFLAQAVEAPFIDALFAEMQKIHQTGTVIADFKYGNIIIEENSGAPYLIDFENAFSYPRPQGAFFRFLRDLDRELFNMHFGAAKLTYRRLRKLIRNRELPAFGKWYAPLYIGSGLRIGRIWDIDVGSGRWRYILRDRLPDFSGKRILDLGANNAFNGIHMLRHGAQEVIGIELDSDHIAQGRLVKDIYEWADNRSYNFRYIQANMADVPTLNLGHFDYVTAFCCIYYLDDAAINELVRYLSTVAGILVLQCNHYANVGRREAHTYEKARLDYALQALERNGFTRCQVFAPDGYKRPLAIGYRD